MPVDAVAFGGDGVFERAHCEAMAKIVQPRAWLSGSATKPDLACKLDERAGHDVGIDRSAGGENEQVLTWLPESVDAILLLRSFYKSGRWNCLQRMAMTPVGVSA